MQPSPHFCSRPEAEAVLAGRTVAIVGSGPGVLENEPGFVDSHQVIVRVNNHKCSAAAGRRTDVHYSFYGSSIRKPAAELQAEGVRLCVCKCPNGQPIESEWHRQRNKMNGVDFTYIYRARAAWWFCPTFVPDAAEFMAGFNLLGGHVPTTGFSAVLFALSCRPASVYLTGFDFFASGVHNVDERWRPGDPTDPIGHVPHVERQWLADNLRHHDITCDRRLAGILKG
jgi:hypothetical protein